MARLPRSSELRMARGNRVTGRRLPTPQEMNGDRVWACNSWCPPLRADRGMNRRACLLECSAPTDIGDCVVDVGVSWLRVFLQQSRDGHDHAALTVAALRDVEVDPGLLDPGENAVLGEAFYGGDLLPDGVAGRDAARTYRRAVNVHGAGATLRDSASVFCPGHADGIADNPQQWRIGFHIDIM